MSIKKHGLKRENKYEQFYTREKIAEKCMIKLKKKININDFDIIIEPSAGNGSFVTAFKNIFNDCKKCKIKSYDIDPKKKYIIKQDYLKLNIDRFKKKKCLVIGNPPFGRQSSLAKKFIRKSTEYANVIAFILSKSFKKQSMNKSFDLNFHLISQWDLPKNSFLLDNKIYDVPCVFQIWKKKDKKRKLDDLKYIPTNFKFVNENENADFSIRRIGGVAGKTQRNTQVSKESHYFIKLNKKRYIKKIIKEMNNIKWKHNNTIGYNSISKHELKIIDVIIDKLNNKKNG